MVSCFFVDYDLGMLIVRQKQLVGFNIWIS